MPSRTAHAHNATVRLHTGDPDAIGAAITVALCGTFDHDGPCPLAPHHTSWHTDPNAPQIIHTRTLYAVDPAHHHDATTRIREGLATGKLIAPGGHTATWRLLDDHPSTVEPHETNHAAQLTGH